MIGQILDPIPIWAMYLLTVLVLLVAMEAGYRLTKANQRKQPEKGDAVVGAMAGAAGVPAGLCGRFCCKPLQRETPVGDKRSQCHRHRLPAGWLSR